MKADLDEYRCPDETYQLLCKWGRCYMIGSPHLKHPTRSAVVGEYLPPRVKDDSDPPKHDAADFDRLCEIIDSLEKPKIDALKCKFMYRTKQGRWWNRRQSAKHLNLTIDDYITLLRSAMRIIDIKMAEEIN